MTDYQFHSGDCPLWHPEKYINGVPASASRCWCQRWSNLVDWSLNSEVQDVPKEQNADKSPRQKPAPSLQTDAFLGSNLWSLDELKDASVDLDVLWKKLDSGSSDGSEPSGSDTKPNLGPSLSPHSSPSGSGSSSASGSGTSSSLSVSPPFGSPPQVQSPVSNELNNCLDALSLALPSAARTSEVATKSAGQMPLPLGHLAPGGQGVDELKSLGPLVAQHQQQQQQQPSSSLAAPGIGAHQPQGQGQDQEQPLAKVPKRRGRPPGRTNSNTNGQPKTPKRPRRRSPSITESLSSDFDPSTFIITSDDLKPVPVLKKSKKKLTPEEMKDDKYWARREKNNMAAKRSRDIRRIKENQIALRAAFLESEVI